MADDLHVPQPDVLSRSTAGEHSVLMHDRKPSFGDPFEIDPGDAEAVLEAAGGCGPFQARHAALSFVAAAIASCHIMAMYYVHLPLEVECQREGGCQAPPVAAEDDGPAVDDWCDHGELLRSAGFGLTGPDSIRKEWNLICDRDWYVPLSDSVFFVGWLLGGIIAGRIGDVAGRRRPLVGYCLGAAAALAATSLAQQVATFILAKFVHGLFTGPILLASYVYGSELVPMSRSAAHGTFYFMVAAAGCVVLAAVAHALQDSWRVLSLTLAAATAAIIPWPLMSPESPTWLLSVGRIAEGTQALERIARVNSSPCCGAAHPPPSIRVAQSSRMQAAAAPEPVSAFALLSDSSIRRTTLSMAFVWLAASLCYFGLSLSGATLPGNAYVNAALLSAAELPVYPAQLLLVDQPMLGRRGTMIGSLLVGALMCFANLLPIGEAARWMAFAGNMCMTAAFTTTYIWSAEVFPSDVRASGLGVCTAGGKLGSVVTPFIVSLGSGSLALAMALFGAVALIGAVNAATLPETLGVAPVATLAEWKQPHAAAHAASSPPLTSARPLSAPIPITSMENGSFGRPRRPHSYRLRPASLKQGYPCPMSL